MVETLIASQTVPLMRDESGTWRVGGTRIPLERVIEAYRDGATPESIVRSFDSLRLADVYAVLSYYLNHTWEVDEYLGAREKGAEDIRHRIEAAQAARSGLRDELLARRARREAGGAPAGQ